MFAVGDLVKRNGDYRLYLIVESNATKQECKLKYIYANPSTLETVNERFANLEFIDHLDL